MTAAKHIAILLPDLRGGGAERVSIDLARAFDALGYSVEFILLSAIGEFVSECKTDFPVLDLGVDRVRQCIVPLARYLRQVRPAALIVMMWPLTALAPMISKFLNLPTRVLVCEHGILSRQYRSWGLYQNVVLRLSTAIGYRLADARVGVSRGAANDMASIARLAPTEITKIYNAVSALAPPKSAALAAAEALWGTQGSRIVTVGNLKSVKNHALMLNAFASLPDRISRLMIVGGGENEGALRQLAHELGVADRVILPGFHSDPARFYATADLFVLSSDHEALPTVIIEALSFGLPVVSTDCPFGPAEILENGKWGTLVPVQDANALARAMEEALAAPVDREALKRRAADFAPEVAARKYLDLLGLA